MSNKSRTRSQELRRLKAETARREARTRRIVTLVGGLVVLVLVGAIAFAVHQASQSTDSTASPSGKVVVPASVKDGSIPVGDPGAPVTVTIYLDYMCPACGKFEATQGKDLDQMIEDGKVRVELRPIAFLDRASQGTKYSTRAANAVATVADGSPEHVWALNQSLYAHQPQEGSTGLTDDQIAELARTAGVPTAVVDRFTKREFEPWVQKFTQDAFDAGIESTPTVRVDGKDLADVFTPGALKRAVDQAAGSNG
ncbi:DsbA family protein [Nocardioides marmoribigeumensis]|uniref:Protein-disulfide isomerase n=1 Tax=Nocardioides marmoribigeumensis TaxID=433649 RepID=A0ABU2BSZ1_9ACTN|nr:thioredoxin domain-containing protein [Nocardioides marmoribigeumensis]MDR7360469.1 protein-disulfide isomerase [Nocardioides marmoribigeumensis]